jgi:hypothetical protein
MTDRTVPERQADPDFDGTFEGTRRRQFLLGLELDYAGRLRWLEAKMSELRELQGKAGPVSE